MGDGCMWLELEDCAVGGATTGDPGDGPCVRCSCIFRSCLICCIVFSMSGSVFVAADVAAVGALDAALIALVPRLEDGLTCVGGCAMAASLRFSGSSSSSYLYCERSGNPLSRGSSAALTVSLLSGFWGTPNCH